MDPDDSFTIYIYLVKRTLDRATTDEITLTFSEITAEKIEKIELCLEFSNEDTLSTKDTIERYWH